jgi:hypothetical protein
MASVRDRDGDVREAGPHDLLWTCLTQEMDQVCAEWLHDEFGPLEIL